MRERPARTLALTVLLPLAVLLLLAGCKRGAREVPELPDPPSIVEPVPTSPTPADAGLPGQWEALPGAAPAARSFLAEPPPGAAARVGVLLVHGTWGVNEHVRTLARQLAERGHLVVVPDLFEGVVVTSRNTASEFIAGVTQERANALLGAGLARLRSDARVPGGRVALLVLGIGGGWASRFAAQGAQFAGIVFDNTPLYRDADAPLGLSGPVLILTGELSSGFTDEHRAAVDAAFRQKGVPLAWARIPGAGTDLLDPAALGFSHSGYVMALDKVAEFLQSVG